jgi:chaperone modulatory protein CbpM
MSHLPSSSTRASTSASAPATALRAFIVEQELHYSWIELRRACEGPCCSDGSDGSGGSAPSDTRLQALVDEGVLQPRGDGVSDWVFDGHDLPRARTALRLMNDLALSAAGVALVLDLLARIQGLEAQLTRMGWR